MIRLEKNKEYIQMKNEKGITLIALAITIVVLIILASVATYSGAESLRNAKEETKLSELRMLQEVVIENYTKYKVAQDTTYLMGNPIEYSEASNLMDEINASSSVENYLKESPYGFVSNYSNYETDPSKIVKQPYYYYELTEDDLTKMNLSQVKYTYVVNYETGEVMNKTLLATKTGEPLYIYSTYPNGEIMGANVYPSKQDTYVSELNINVQAGAYYGISEIKYKWTNILKEPSKDEFAETVPSTNIVPIPQDVLGNYYLWIYIKDQEGNEKISSFGGYMIDNVATKVSFSPNENPTWITHQKVTVSVEANKEIVQKKYYWSLSSETPSKSTILNFGTTLTSNEVTSPDGLEGHYNLWVYAKDSENREKIMKSGEYYIDNVGPTIVKYTKTIQNSNIIFTINQVVDNGVGTIQDYKIWDWYVETGNAYWSLAARDRNTTNNSVQTIGANTKGKKYAINAYDSLGNAGKMIEIVGDGTN